MAAAFPDSGTPTTTSASTGLSFARHLPAVIRESYTDIPSMTESSLAKYIYSNIHLACCSWHMFLYDWIPYSGDMVTTSPGSTSLTNSAPIVSSAQLSDASMYALSRFPIQSGLKPNGSLAPISFLGLMMTSEYDPLTFLRALVTASSTEPHLTLSLAIW